MGLPIGLSKVFTCPSIPFTRTAGVVRLMDSRFANYLCARMLTTTLFFYGVNFEFSVNYNYWETRTITSEIRPIVGVHLHPVDIIFNPIMDTDYTGGLKNLEFVPSTRIAYNVNDKWAVAAEEYADLGPFRHFLPGNEQFHEVWAVMDRASKVLAVEAGVGVESRPGPTN